MFLYCDWLFVPCRLYQEDLLAPARSDSAAQVGRCWSKRPMSRSGNQLSCSDPHEPTSEAVEGICRSISAECAANSEQETGPMA